MSQKQAKKLRQMYRRDMGRTLEEQVEAYRQQLDTLLKPAPKWIPDFIWVAIQKKLLNV